MSATAAPSSSDTKEGNNGSSDSVSASNIHIQLLISDNLHASLFSGFFFIESTLSVLKQLQASSVGFIDFYGKVWNQITDDKRMQYRTSFVKIVRHISYPLLM